MVTAVRKTVAPYILFVAEFDSRVQAPRSGGAVELSGARERVSDGRLGAPAAPRNWPSRVNIKYKITFSKKGKKKAPMCVRALKNLYFFNLNDMY